MTQPYRILIAEDEADIRFMTSFTLRYGGFEVIEAADGAEALELAQREHPDLILLDAKMPRMDGYEACRRIKAQPTLQQIPIIFLSALGQQQEVARGRAAGAIDYLLKPYVPEELINKVRSILEGA